MAATAMPTTPNTKLNLPAGFRFHPTDEELIVHYLMNQAAGIPCLAPIIAEVNIYHCNPWELPAKAVFGDSEWYFFSPRDRKYPNGARPNRAAGSGYWKATGTDKAITCARTGSHVGVKKALVFYGGRPPRGVKTDWIMHEYRLVTANAAGGKTPATPPARRRPGSSMRLDDWVLCRIYKKSNDFHLLSSSEQEGSSTVEQEESPKSDPLDEHELEHDYHQFQQLHHTTTTTMSKSCSLTDLLNSIDCSALSELLDGGEPTLPLPPQENPPPLIYPTMTTTHETQQSSLNYNTTTTTNNNNNLINNNRLINLPDTTAASSSDYVVANNNYNNGEAMNNKRKRMMTAGESSLDHRSNGFISSSKLKVLPSSRAGPSDSRNSSSSYCNQQVVETTGLLFQSSYNNSSSLLMSYPFLEMQ